MSAFTIENLRNVDDSAPSFGFGEIGDARFAKDSVDAESTGLSYFRVNPGKRQPFGHHHDAAEEVYVIMSGSGRMRLAAEVRAVKALDATRVPPAVVRAFEPGDDGLEYVAFGPRHDGDG